MAPRRGTAAAVIITLLLATVAAVAAAATVHRAEQHRADQERADEADRAAADLESRFTVALRGLNTIQDFFASSQEVTGPEFATFARGLQPDSPIVATMLVSRVPAPLRRSFERLPGSQPIRQRAGSRLLRAPARPDYYPVSYRFSRFDSRLPIGLDLAADPVRGKALLAARDIGRARATPPVTLSESGHRGLLLFLPIYRKGAPLRTVDERRAAIKALAATAFETKQLGDAVRALRRPGTKLQIMDGDQRVYGSPGRLTDAVTREVRAAGRSWRLRVQSPVSSTTALPLTILLGGLVLVGLVGLLLLGLSRRERYAQRLSDRRLAERDRAEGAQRAAEERFRRAFEDSGVAMALVGIEGEEADRLLEVNDALCALTGFDRDALATKTLPDLLEAEDEKAAATGQSERRLARPGGDPTWVLLTTSDVRDAEGEPSHRIAQLQDVSERKRFEARLKHLADHDSLTGLFNRRRFEEELEREVSAARRYRRGGAVLTLDLDHFKYTNDSLGHSVGDELIRRAGEVLDQRLRQSDTVARLGGDEFAAILPEADEPEAVRVAEYLLRSIRDEATVTGKHGRTGTTASIGITLFAGQGSDAPTEELLAQADIAMYDAKEGGRDRYTVYAAQGRDALMAGRLDWVERIRQALAEDRFVLHGQPILGLGDDVRPREELLLRMVDHDGDLIPPASFLHVAERFDLIQEIDRWVVSHAIDLLARLEREGTPAVLEVNLSAKSVTDPTLAATIEAWVGEAGIDPTGLVFEMTETAAIVNVDRAKAFAAAIHAIGCEFAIDDFGAGFASFYYLKHLAFDYLKIDGEFIKDLPQDETNQLLVAALVEIAEGLGKRTIAEFVGDQATLDLLRELRVDYAQGYFVAHPRSIEGQGFPAPVRS